MAFPGVQIVLSAIDKTKTAFAAVKGGLSDVGRKAAEFNATMGSLFAGISVLGFVGQIKQSIDAMDEANKAAQKVGTSVENFSALSFAASQANVPVEELQKGLAKLAKTLDDAKAGSGPAAEAFARLKIDPKKFTDPADALLVIAARFKALPDSVNKTALAMDLFGKAGANMIPLLNAGKDGIQAMMEEARRLGVVFDSETAQAAENLNDNLDKLKTAMRGFNTQAANAVVPALTQIAKAMTEAAKEGGLLEAAWVGLGGLGVAVLTDELKGLETQLGRAKRALDDALKGGAGEDAPAVIAARKAIAAIEEQMALEKKANDQRKQDNKATSDAAIENTKAAQDAFKKATNEQISDAQRLRDALVAAFDASFKAEQDYLAQAKKLRADASKTTPIEGDVQSQALAQLDAITALQKLQRISGTDTLTNVKQQADAARELASMLEDAALKADLLKQANLEEAKALEKAAAEEKARQQGLTDQQKLNQKDLGELQQTLDNIGKPVEAKVTVSPETQAAHATLQDMKYLIDYIKSTPVSLNISSNSANIGQAVQDASLKRGTSP